MDIIEDLPILILGYNRKDKFLRCITTLKEYGSRNIYISLDGPKNDFDKEIQKQILDFCNENQFDLNIKVKKLNKNYGCRVAPIKGISWFFKENEYGVVLEDDVIISKKCLEIFGFSLIENIKNDNLLSISSFNEFTNKKVESLYLLPVWRSWGWASWSKKWNFHLEFSNKIKNLTIWQIYKLMPRELRSIETAELIKSCQLNLMDAWDYEFNFSHIINKKKSLTIGGINNFVYGFDESATHTKNISNVGIDFSLFCERHIEKSKVLNLENKKIIATLKKCGFNNTKDQKFYYLIQDFCRSLFYSFIFYLRKVKRNMYKKNLLN